MLIFTHQFRGHTATFTMRFDENLAARWVVEIAGSTREFTCEEWAEFGLDWLLQVVPLTALSIAS